MTYALTTTDTSSHGASLFFGALAVATLAPLIITPLLMPGQPPSGVTLFTLLTFGHVGASAFLFMDREFRPLIRPRLALFIVVPVLAAISMGLSAAAFPAAAPVLLLLGYAWTIHHFGRQNFGIVNFGLKAAGLRPLRRLNDAIALTAAAALLGVIASHTAPHLPAIAPPILLYTLAGGLYLAGLGLVGVECFVRRLELARSPVALATLVGAAVFFLPALMPGGAGAVFWSYGIAHGAQYLIFMLVLAWQAPDRAIALARLSAGVMVGGVFFLQMVAQLSETAQLGLVFGHFLVDAKVWKLRGAQQSPIPTRFAFLHH